jgi:surfeit locus 1 family protein
MIKRSSILLGLLAILVAALFVRLGLWQLDRHGQRTAANAFRSSRGALPPVRLTVPGRGTATAPPPDSVAWRRVRVAGRFDREREMIIRSRSRDGAPGVELLTPLLIGRDSVADEAILVLRGWLPAPDGIRPRLSDGWRPGCR